jgi:hypothetical protein
MDHDRASQSSYAQLASQPSTRSAGALTVTSLACANPISPPHRGHELGHVDALPPQVRRVDDDRGTLAFGGGRESARQSPEAAASDEDQASVDAAIGPASLLRLCSSTTP